MKNTTYTMELDTELDIQEFYGENLDDGDFYGSVDECESSVLKIDEYGIDFLGLGSTGLRKLKSKTGDLLIAAERAVNSADKNMGAPLLSNDRLEIAPVVDNELIKGICLENGFTESELVNAVFLAVPAGLTVMPIAQWVVDKYTTNASSFSKITVYDKANFTYNTVGFGFNNMEHDRGSKIVIGGKIGSKTYVAPYMLVEKLNELNTLNNQLFEGYLLGINENEKKALKYSQSSHYYRNLREKAYNKVFSTENENTEPVFEENTENAWAFKVLDNYYKANRDFWKSELELDIMELQEVLISSLQAQDWRYAENTIARAVIRENNKILSSFIDFYNGEAVIDAINELELDKTKFAAVQAELVKLAKYYLANESDEDNAFSVDEKLEDYDSNKGTDYSQSRGYKKAYLEKPIVEKAIARGVITEYIYTEHYTRSFECYAMELELSELRKSSVAHEEEQKARFKEMAKEQAFWDRMEKELGVTGLTAFTPASNCPDREAEWAARSDEHFAYFLSNLEGKLC